MNNSIAVHDVLFVDVPSVKMCVAIAAILLAWRAIDRGYSIRVSGSNKGEGTDFGIELISQAA